MAKQEAAAVKKEAPKKEAPKKEAPRKPVPVPRLLSSTRRKTCLD